MNTRLRYLVASSLNVLARRRLQCPSCDARKSKIVARKYLVTTLRRCDVCQLLYRAPTTSQRLYEKYYEKEYQSGLTTELPNESGLQKLMAQNFKGTEKDFSRYIKILEALGVHKGSRILDYGCSWGYGCWQLENAGYNVVGYELSKERAAFARKMLSVEVVSGIHDICGEFDVFFSTHVIEHIPNVANFLDFAFTRLQKSGLFMAVTPNGSFCYRTKRPGNWQRVWGFKHPVLLDEKFIQQTFSKYPWLATSQLENYDAMSSWQTDGGLYLGDMSGWELLLVSRLKP